MFKSERWKLLWYYVLWFVYGALGMLCGACIGFACLVFPGLYTLVYIKTEPFNAIMSALMCIINWVTFADMEDIADGQFRIFEFCDRFDAKQKKFHKRIERQKRFMRLCEKREREGINIFTEYELSCILSEEEEEK